MARQALRRQARQSATAAWVAALGLLVLAPFMVLARAVVRVALAHEMPFGEVALLSALSVFVNVLTEQLSRSIMRRKMRWPFAFRVMAVQVAMWAAVVAVAKGNDVQDIDTWSIPLCLVISIMSPPVAVVIGREQHVQRKMRQALRELATGVLRASVVGTGLTVVLYVYLTVFTELAPAAEFAVMGLAMPVLQAICMSLLARLTRRHERAMRRGAGTPQASAPAAQAACKYATETASGRPLVKTLMHLKIVLVTELCFTTGAFTTLILAGSDQSFYMSLVSMLCIEVVQVALHVKARRMVSRVLAESTGVPAKLSDARLRQWLLHQELGEKLGMLLSLGLLRIDQALGREVPVVQALTPLWLLHRGIAMLLVGLAGDVGKDLVSQAMGLIPAGETAAVQVPMPPLAVGFVLLQALIAGFLVQTGLALGT